MNERRFIRVEQESKHLSTTEVWADSVTGVQYIFHMSGYSGGMCVLVDKEGKPLLADDRTIDELRYR